jgi:hypothetical protein
MGVLTMMAIIHLSHQILATIWTVGTYATCQLSFPNLLFSFGMEIAQIVV